MCLKLSEQERTESYLLDQAIHTASAKQDPSLSAPQKQCKQKCADCKLVLKSLE
ncbi:hypothetical protein SAMN05518847_11244 [Paenibacillus sp. OV219]|nr:hypothetical protein SAMN05518847_11244 [Paenibacillus sp. OV219]